jgi:hypothetical protein
LDLFIFLTSAIFYVWHDIYSKKIITGRLPQGFHPIRDETIQTN